MFSGLVNVGAWRNHEPICALVSLMSPRDRRTCQTWQTEGLELSREGSRGDAALELPARWWH